MSEQMKNSLNDPTTTLASDITSTATSLSVQSGHGSRFPSTGDFRIKIGTELILVGGRSGDTLSSLTRGIEGTTNVAHTTGDSIELVATQTGLLNYIQENAAVVSSTVSGLGTGTKGKIGLIRGGSSPYEFLSLIYDDTYGKWVTPQVHICRPVLASWTQAATTYGAGGITNPATHGHDIIFDYKALWDAGLRLQVRAFAKLSNSGGGNTTYLGITGSEVSDADTAFSADVFTAQGEISNVGSTATFKASAWTQPADWTPAKNHLRLTVVAKVSAGTGTLVDACGAYRWVAV